MVRERATTAREFDPAEIRRGHHSDAAPSAFLAALPLVVVVAVNLVMSLVARVARIRKILDNAAPISLSSPFLT
jgi:hypothetical protein